MTDGDIAASRFLARMTVSSTMPRVATGGLKGRPVIAASGLPRVLLPGDWVGPRGMLAEVHQFVETYGDFEGLVELTTRRRILPAATLLQRARVDKAPSPPPRPKGPTAPRAPVRWPGSVRPPG